MPEDRVGHRAKTTLVCALACLFLIGLPAAHADPPEILEQPADVQRPQVVQIDWVGPSAEVAVERSDGSEWAAEASDADGEVLLEDAGDGIWSARWQAAYDTPSGTYRIRLAGEGFDVTSDEFTVRRCSCVIPGPVKAKRRRGRFHVSVRGEYLPAPRDGFQELPLWVTTGRAKVRVLRDGRRVGKVILRYKRGKFRGKWRGRKGPPNSVVFKLVSLKDQWGNR